MKKMTVIVALCLMLCAPLAAEGSGYLDVGLGPELTLKIYHVETSQSEIDPLLYSGYGGSLNLSGGYMFNPYFGLGLKTGVLYNTSRIADNIGTFSLPLMLEAVIRPTFGILSFPIKIGAGGYVQFAGNTYAFGPAAAVSLGLACRVAENFIIGYSSTATLLVQMFDGFKNMTYQVNLTPFAITATLYL